LYRLLHDEEIIVPFVLVRKFSLDVAKGMVYLHNSNPVILHRDLKSHNLLVDENFKVKISDFGLSKVMDPHQKTMTSCGTAAWAAPEILKNATYTEKADIYSYGICLWEFFTRKDPYEGMPVFQIIFAVGSEGLRPTIPENCPPEYSLLMEECWQTDPTTRPTFEQILHRLLGMEGGPEQLGSPAFLNSRHAKTEDVQHRSDVSEPNEASSPLPTTPTTTKSKTPKSHHLKREHSSINGHDGGLYPLINDPDLRKLGEEFEKIADGLSNVTTNV